MARTPLQRQRALTQAAFFTLFILAPVFDILRLDLTRGHFILFGWDWTLGLEGFLAGQEGGGRAALHLLVRGFLPIVLIGGTLLWTAWRFGRLYCGWLCPHFSVLEMINGLMARASGRPSLWERRPLPPRQPDGTARIPNPWYWLPALLAVVGFAFLWAVVFLTYLLPPAEVYGNLFHGTPTRNQTIFLTAATLALSVEFLLARHFFCRFGCAVGLFQSLVWMANDRAMVVGFDTQRAAACQDCNNACDNACPMRLKPRTIKRRMFTCTECGECIAACSQVQAGAPAGIAGKPAAGLLRWVQGEAALPVVTGRPGTIPRASEPAADSAVASGPPLPATGSPLCESPTSGTGLTCS